MLLDYSAEMLLWIRSNLYYGDMKSIAEELDVKPQTVAKVLRGITTSKKICNAAYKKALMNVHTIEEMERQYRIGRE